MTNRTDDLTRSINLDALIAYATINYIPPTTSTDDIESLDTIISEMRDCFADILDELLPTSINHSLALDELDAIITPHFDALLDSTEFYSRILDIALARYRA